MNPLKGCTSKSIENPYYLKAHIENYSATDRIIRVNSFYSHIFRYVLCPAVYIITSSLTFLNELDVRPIKLEEKSYVRI